MIDKESMGANKISLECDKMQRGIKNLTAIHQDRISDDNFCSK